MKRLLLLSVLLSLLVSCGGRRQIEKALYSGNYDQAISNALNKLDHNKHKKRKQQFVLMLEDAYHKVVERDLNTIDHLKKDGNPEHYKAIYDLYVNLDARQEAIKPVLPLKVGRRVIKFDFKDWSDEIISARDNVSTYTYEKALGLMESYNKYDQREAFRLLKCIDDINPNYKDVRILMDDAHFNGTDFILVSIKNQTHQIIPNRLEDELLNFDTYGLNNFWTVYHANPDAAINYNFAMELQLRDIQISPERILERQHLRERQIVDGWEYQLDENGNVARDSLGNDIKIDRIVNVRARVFEIEQLKSTRVLGRVVYTDLNTNQPLESFPLDSEFVFQNFFGRYRGDKRALNDQDLDLINRRRIPFPTNSQMVYDTGEDLKHQLKRILNSYAFND